MSSNFSVYVPLPFPSSPSDVKTYIDSWKSNAVGYDDIPANLLKQTSDYVLRPLTHIINLTFCCGIFTDKLKIAKAISIFKSGSKENLFLFFYIINRLRQ